MKRSEQNKECKDEISTAKHARTEIPDIVNELVSTCNKGGCFDHVSAEPIPYREAIIDILRRSALILYPGYFIRRRLDQINLEYYLGQEVTAFYEILSEQIILALRHDCIRQNLACIKCEGLGQAITIEFLKSLPGLRGLLAKDIRAAYDGDPAAKGYDEIIFSYPGIWAIMVYRLAVFLNLAREYTKQRRNPMGERGSKKDKNKAEKQKKEQLEKKKEEQKNKLPAKKPA